MPDEDDQISRLLRLKRYEQPPPGYFEDFLKEFQRRQRAELLRRPLWRVALDRLSAFRETFSASQLSYGAASVAVLMIATVFTVEMLRAPMPMQTGGPALAAAPSAPARPAPAAVASAPAGPASPNRLVSAPTTTRRILSLESPGLQEPELSIRPRVDSAVLHQPRYILDSRPASYDAPFDF